MLSGASGTGKSSLFKLYAQCAAEGQHDSNTPSGNTLRLWHRMNVVSTWIEPADLLGWRNPLAKDNDHSFQPAPGGLFEFLNGIQDKPFNEMMSLLCFEEMNLAQAELYFSDFLQAIGESPCERTIVNPEGGSFRIPNLRIVGTCNIDHTTKPFTERFLDRCNYITLSGPGKDDKSEPFFPDSLPDEHPVFQHGFVCPEPVGQGSPSLDTTVPKNVMEDLVTSLSSLNLYPSRRVRKNMAEYILNRPAVSEIAEGNAAKAVNVSLDQARLLAFDEAIVQRVLSKLTLRNEWERDGDFTKQLNQLRSVCEKAKLTLSVEYIDAVLSTSSKA
jgi:hypothetical protein